MMTKAMNRKKGIQQGLYDRLEDLDFADDICLLAQRFKDMEAKLNDLKVEAQNTGMTINSQKTKEMRVNPKNKDRFYLEGRETEEVNKFCYLGCTVSLDGGANEDVINRINKAKGAFAQLRSIWTSHQIHKRTKITIFKSNVMSVLLYGCETWKITQDIINKLQTFVNRCLRNILRIWRPKTITNKELWETTQQIPNDREIKIRKWKWFGNTLRKDQNNITRQGLDWNPQEERRKGRPRITWKRTILTELQEQNVSWKEAKHMAKNRVRWQKFVMAPCST
jgi:hypothetical protein